MFKNQHAKGFQSVSMQFAFWNRAIRFKGFQQQDSQELLRYLLDGMRTEEIQVCLSCNAPQAFEIKWATPSFVDNTFQSRDQCQENKMPN